MANKLVPNITFQKSILKRSVDASNARANSQRVTIFQGETHAVNLCKILNDLRLQGLCCDISLRVKENSTGTITKRADGSLYKAHSVVLAARSRFFKNLFLNPCNVGRTTFILPSFINSRAVEIVLHYIYTGRLGIREDTVSSIYQVGWLFQMEDVQLLCGQFCKMKNFKPPSIEVNKPRSVKTHPVEENDGSDNETQAPNFKKCRKRYSRKCKNVSRSDDLLDEAMQHLKHLEGKPESVKSTVNQRGTAAQPEMSVTLNQNVAKKDDKNCAGSEVKLQDVPPEIIECTPMILEDEENCNLDSESTVEAAENNCHDDVDTADEGSDRRSKLISEDEYEGESEENIICQTNAPFNSVPHKSEKKLVIITPIKTEEHTEIGVDVVKSPNEDVMTNVKTIVVNFKPYGEKYSNLVLFVLDGIKNYVELLINHGFFHIEFHVDNVCRKGLVKTDGNLVCVMFGQVNYCFPIGHKVTNDDVERYQKQEQQQTTTAGNNKMKEIIVGEVHNEAENPIFGKDQECEKDVLQCFACSCVFFTIQGKSSHLMRHHKRFLSPETETGSSYKFNCDTCDFQCANLRWLYFHRLRIHGWKLPEVVLQFRCGLCFAVEFSIHTARDHFKQFHKEAMLRSTFSDKFNSVSPTVASVDSPMATKRKSCNDNEQMSIKAEKFECGKCKERFPTQKLLIRHSCLKAITNLHQCEHCEYTAENVDKLRKHLQTNCKRSKNATVEVGTPQRRSCRMRRKNTRID